MSNLRQAASSCQRLASFSQTCSVFLPQKTILYQILYIKGIKGLRTLRSLIALLEFALCPDFIVMAVEGIFDLEAAKDPMELLVIAGENKDVVGAQYALALMNSHCSIDRPFKEIVELDDALERTFSRLPQKWQLELLTAITSSSYCFLSKHGRGSSGLDWEFVSKIFNPL
ncbi:uncharacterized protein I206_104002 [Kwoniella pini CBS 10737]|uniref:Uncharacterized protein n=1 Tax=Kwoniella pini CBS 10737 TaxID=1296096 RepID=A0AAJ8MQV0_9TREE